MATGAPPRKSFSGVFVSFDVGRPSRKSFQQEKRYHYQQGGAGRDIWL